MASNSLFGRFHSVTQDIRGNNVISVEVDQQNPQNVFITSTDSIKLYEVEGRTVLSSWICKSWISPSSGCNNDSSGNFYCTVSNNKLLGWTADQDELDKIKPTKLSSNIHSLLPHKGSVYVVFNSGFVENVTKVLQYKKESVPQLLPQNDIIRDVIITEDMVTLATSDKVSNSIVPLRLHHFPLGCSSPTDVSSTNVALPDLSLMGLGLTSRGTVVTLWSNGDLCSGVVGSASNNSGGSQQLRLVGSCKASLTCSKPVRMLQASPRHLAILGQDIGQDGGRVCMWDLDLFLEVGSRHFKLYQRGLRCWSLPAAEGDGGGTAALLLQEKQQLTVIPLVQLPKPGLQQIFEAGFSTNLELLKDGSSGRLPLARQGGGGGWSKKVSKRPQLQHNGLVSTSKKNKDRSLVNKLVNSLNLTQLDSSVCCEKLMEQAVKERDFSLVCEVLARFRELPEHCIVSLLDLILEQDLSHDKKVAKCIERTFGAVSEQRQETVANKTDDAQRKGNRDWKHRNGHSSSKLANGGVGMELDVCNGLQNSDDDSDSMNSSDEEEEQQEDEDKKRRKIALIRDHMSLPQWRLVNMLLAEAVMEAALVQQLRRLPYRKAMEVAKHINVLIYYNLAPQGGQEQRSSRGLCPTVAQVYQWHSLLYDAHHHNLMLDLRLRNTLPYTQRNKRVCRQESNNVDVATQLMSFLQNLSGDINGEPGSVQCDSINGAAVDDDPLYSIEKIRVLV